MREWLLFWGTSYDKGVLKMDVLEHNMYWNVESNLKKKNPHISAHSKHVLILGVSFKKTKDLLRWAIRKTNLSNKFSPFPIKKPKLNRK